VRIKKTTTNVVFSERDETTNTNPKILENINIECCEKEKFSKILTQSTNSNKNEINKCYINNFYSQNKIKELFSTKNNNNTNPIFSNEKPKKNNFNIIWTEDDIILKGKVDRISSYFKDLDILNCQFTEQINQCKCELNNLS